MRFLSTLNTPLQSSSTSTHLIMTKSSLWHSPVPYLFGGLAAMLGLISFALLILACSYWKMLRNGGRNDGDLENGGEKTGDGCEHGKSEIVYEEKIVVIMAGDFNPTFLATPMAIHKTEETRRKTEEGEKTEEKISATTTGESEERDREVGERETHLSQLMNDEQNH